MADESKGPDGWEAEEYDREKIRELRDEGMDPASAQQKLSAMGHPSTRSMGTDGRPGDVEEPVSGEGTGEAQQPGGDEEGMAARGAPTGGTNRSESQAAEETNEPR